MPAVAHQTYEAFRNAVLNRYFDLDGYYGAQCWDGVQLLYTQSDINQNLITQHNLNPSLKGYVKTCWINTTCRQTNGSGHFIQIANKTDIKRGDIIVFDTLAGWYGVTGHIAFADENYRTSGQTNKINLLGQNQGVGSNPYTGKAFNIWEGMLDGAFLGAFRYTEWEGDTPSPTPTPTGVSKKHKFPWAVAWAHWGYRK